MIATSIPFWVSIIDQSMTYLEHCTNTNKLFALIHSNLCLDLHP